MITKNLVNLFFRLWLKPLWRSIPSVAMVRRKYLFADRLAATGQVPPTLQYQDIGGVAVEWIGANADVSRGMILYLHGGGFVVRAEQTDRRFCQKLSSTSGLPALLVPYRLAPEHPYPAGLDDCCAVYAALLHRGVPPDRIVIIGHSAGANYALALLMRARQQGLAQPAGAILLSPPTDLSAGSPSAKLNATRDVMQGPTIWPWVRREYLRNIAPDHPEVSPLFGDWTQLAPLSFHVSDSEIIFDDSRRAVEQARKSGTSTQLSVWNNLPHNFYFIDFLAESQQCRRQMLEFILSALACGNDNNTSNKEGQPDLS
jgi:epsilon-lactone hydrolase